MQLLNWRKLHINSNYYCSEFNQCGLKIATNYIAHYSKLPRVSVSCFQHRRVIGMAKESVFVHGHKFIGIVSRVHHRWLPLHENKDKQKKSSASILLHHKRPTVHGIKMWWQLQYRTSSVISCLLCVCVCAYVCACACMLITYVAIQS